jgi:hypothetical protein
MKKNSLYCIIVALAIVLAGGCDVPDTGLIFVPDTTLKVADENDPIVIPDSAAMSLPASRWSEFGHRSLSSVAATQWGLSAARIANISEASDDPDTYQSGLDNGYNQQWSHAYIYDILFGSVFYLWGDANEDFRDNIEGSTGGEGYNGYSAGYYYGNGSQYQGDRYVGYAMHFIEDVSLVLHSTSPTSMGITVSYNTVDMATNHFKFESWINNNLNSGHMLLNAVENDYSYYAITNTSQAAINAAWLSCAYRGTSSVGYSAWKAYRSAGYPTAAGSGSALLADNTRKMLIAAARYAKGAIKYSLDKYGQWAPQY